jgi:hypothetical protein
MTRIEPSFDRAAESFSEGSRADCELENGVMAGLTAAETQEFVALDARNFIDENGNPFPWPWDTTGAAKDRWLTLFEKHEAALRRIKVLERLRRHHK